MHCVFLTHLIFLSIHKFQNYICFIVAGVTCLLKHSHWLDFLNNKLFSLKNNKYIFINDI